MQMPLCASVYVSISGCMGGSNSAVFASPLPIEAARASIRHVTFQSGWRWLHRLSVMQAELGAGLAISVQPAPALLPPPTTHPIITHNPTYSREERHNK